ncbi:hypothetical protein LguiA_025940 [Lonicera macranthoides]
MAVRLSVLLCIFFESAVVLNTRLFCCAFSDLICEGVIDNKVVAIKMSLRLSPQNEKEFQKEIILFGGVRHANLLELLGYCMAKDVRILIFEFMPNGDLDDFFFGRNRSRNVDVYKRIELIHDVASELNYLHNDSKVRIVHRDIKLKCWYFYKKMELAFLLMLMLLNVGTSTSISIMYRAGAHFCSSNNYFNNTNYKKNVNLALLLLENNIENTFYNSTAGTNGDNCSPAAFL